MTVIGNTSIDYGMLRNCLLRQFPLNKSSTGTLQNIHVVIFYLANGRVDGIGMSVLVVIRGFPAMLMINADGVTLDVIRFLDDPAMPGTSGLDFVVIMCHSDEVEIGRGKQLMFFCGKQCRLTLLLVWCFDGVWHIMGA